MFIRALNSWLYYPQFTNEALRVKLLVQSERMSGYLNLNLGSKTALFILGHLVSQHALNRGPEPAKCATWRH